MDQPIVVIVAAKDAWREYPKTRAYVCQPDRYFRDGVTHLGFYTGNEIKPLIPRIRAYHPNVRLTREEADRWRASDDREVGDLLDLLLDHPSHLATPPRRHGEAYGVMLLTPEHSPETVRLPHVIKNDKVDRAGNRCAWTQRQRYVGLDQVTSGVTSTSEVETGR